MKAELRMKYTAVARVCLWKRSVSVPPEASVLLNLHISHSAHFFSNQLSSVTCAEEGMCHSLQVKTIAWHLTH